MAHDPDPRSDAAPSGDPSPERVPTGWLEQLQQRVSERRLERYEEARQAGARWLVECYDRWEFPRGEEGADLFFDLGTTELEVDALVARFANDRWNWVAGIYDVNQPLGPQGGGLSADAWQARRRQSA
jgi:hypothetical protein